jgi:hypothetical protein
VLWLSSHFPKNCVNANNTDVSRIILVEMAAMVGSIWSRSAMNMLRVSVELTPPETEVPDRMSTTSSQAR